MKLIMMRDTSLIDSFTPFQGFSGLSVDYAGRYPAIKHNVLTARQQMRSIVTTAGNQFNPEDFHALKGHDITGKDTVLSKTIR
jgi:hypothetical protein